MSSQKAPAPPNYAQLLKQGAQINLKQLPANEQAEIAARLQYDPQLIAQQQGLQSQFGPTQYAQQLAARSQLDPLGTATYNALQGNAAQYLRQGALNPQQAAAYAQFGNLASQAAAQGGWTPEQAQAYRTLGQNVTSNLLQGTQADPATLQQMSQAIRSRQGPYSSGNADAMAEAVYRGQRGIQLQQQRQQASGGYLGLQNPMGQAAQALGSFASMQTPQAQAMQAGLGAMSARNPMTDILGIQGVQAPVADQFVNPQAGAQAAQFGLSNYQNLLAQQSLSQGSSNPWLTAAGGVIGGVAGGYFGGPAGASAGAGLGSAAGTQLGGYFSDAKAKTDIIKVGEHNGLDIVEFRYKQGRLRYRGVLAQQVQMKFPAAVGSKDGFLTVDYSQIGIPMEKQCKDCERFKPMDEFQKSSRNYDGRMNVCTECWDDKKRAYRLRYYRENLQDAQAHKTMRLLECDWSTAIQLNVARSMTTECDICGRPPNRQGLVHDHCHKTGKLRGLLCGDCNTALGLFKDDPRILQKAIEHLEKEGRDVRKLEEA